MTHGRKYLLKVVLICVGSIAAAGRLTIKMTVPGCAVVPCTCLLLQLGAPAEQQRSTAGRAMQPTTAPAAVPVAVGVDADPILTLMLSLSGAVVFG